MLRDWHTVTDDLRLLAEPEVVDGGTPRPAMAAFAGDAPVGVAVLRDADPRDLVTPVVELLALLLPLGADRVALSVPARVWHLDDPSGGDVDGADVRPRVLLVTAVDGVGRGRPRVATTVLPYGRDDAGGWGWLPGGPLTGDPGPAEGPVTDALVRLVACRGGPALARLHDTSLVALQYARCLLRGHAIVLAPDAADRLEAATATATPA